MRILGISAFYHDSAAALIENGHIIAAAQEERFSRKKHDSRFPHHAVQYCLTAGGLDVPPEYVVFYDKPFPKFERLLDTYLAFAPSGFRSFSMAMPVWIREKLFQKSLLKRELSKHLSGMGESTELLFAEHHLSHAASAYYPSPFDRAAILTMDGVGEWATTSVGIGRGQNVQITGEIHFPHSLGLLYSAFTYYTGFKVNSGEYKLMGLAPYGRPIYTQKIYDNLIDVKDDGSFRLNLNFFEYCTGLRMTNGAFDSLFEGPARKPDEQITQRHMDLASSVQVVLEDVVLKLARAVAKDTGERNLCMAGGVALNCVANGKLLRDGCFQNIWVQPAAGDAGGALGAALAAYHMYKGQPRVSCGEQDAMHGAYLGPEFRQAEIEDRLHRIGARFVAVNDSCLLHLSERALAEGKALGWFQGRMEFGPRALGARSIVADARSPAMQSMLNLKVKFRESFRPFAPSVLREHVADWFELDGDSPYMLMVAGVAPERRIAMTAAQQELFGIEKLNVPRSDIPAVTHIDYSARIQTVHKETNPRYHALIELFHKRNGCPVVVNTSFNVRGEPIVCTPEDAYRCFMGTQIEALAIGNCFLRKDEQDPSLAREYQTAFEPD